MIFDIVSDEPVPTEMQQDPELWSEGYHATTDAQAWCEPGDCS